MPEREERSLSESEGRWVDMISMALDQKMGLLLSEDSSPLSEELRESLASELGALRSTLFDVNRLYRPYDPDQATCFRQHVIQGVRAAEAALGDPDASLADRVHAARRLTHAHGLPSRLNPATELAIPLPGR